MAYYRRMVEERAVFAAGCFWGVEDRFMKLPGVIQTRVGYTGGTAKNPSYEAVCDGGTGHKEAVEVIFDPEKVSYKKLLKTFWDMHDPTTVNRQGPDVGEQYHSVIFYEDEKQRQEAELSKKELQELGVYKGAIVTDILPVADFYEAEEYHQKYVQKHGVGSCAA